MPLAFKRQLRHIPGNTETKLCFKPISATTYCRSHKFFGLHTGGDFGEVPVHDRHASCRGGLTHPHRTGLLQAQKKGRDSTLKVSPFFLKTSANRMSAAWCDRLRNKIQDLVFSSWSSADIRKLILFIRGTRSHYMLRNKNLRDQGFCGSFLWCIFYAKGRVTRRQSLGARWRKTRRGSDSVGTGGAFGKKVILHWKKGLEPSWSQVMASEACRKLTKGQRRTSRCWKSFWFRRLHPESWITGGFKEELVCALPQFMSSWARQQSRSEGPFICQLQFWYMHHPEFCSYKWEFLRSLFWKEYPFSHWHWFKMSALFLRTSLYPYVLGKIRMFSLFPSPCYSTETVTPHCFMVPLQVWDTPMMCLGPDYKLTPYGSPLL